MPENNGFMVVIGASAGGMQAIGQVLSELRPDIPAAIGVVMHLPEKGENRLFLNRLRTFTSLPCHLAADRMPLQMGHVYLAPAGFHMFVKEKEIGLGKSAIEGRWRPSINAGFRSAAVAWASRCIGIILTGLLDDGAVGMDAVQRCGGFTIVQEPSEAEYPNMPLSVLQMVKVDRRVPLAGIPAAIEERIAMTPPATAIPQELRAENRLSEQMSTAIENTASLGEQCAYSCPDCGGSLWEIHNGQARHYRCHVGHAYTEEELLRLKGQEIEKTLWVALRTLEEKRNLLQRIARREEMRGFTVLSKDHYDRAEEMQKHVERLKSFLLNEETTDADPDDL